MRKSSDVIRIDSIGQFLQMFDFNTDTAPRICVVRLQSGVHYTIDTPLQLNLYAVTCKQGCSGTVRYGWRSYDYSTGCMNFFAPGQIHRFDGEGDAIGSEGWMLLFHPDFLCRYALAEDIKRYHFFSYAVNEALHLSDGEKQRMERIFRDIASECSDSSESVTHDIIVSQIALLLNYAERYYQRQFQTRTGAEQDRLLQIEEVFRANLQTDMPRLITPQILADNLNMTTHYLSDWLQRAIGQNTQQYIHSLVVERAKHILCSRPQLSVKEVAYSLGFEYPQYFTRLFKAKTGQTPVEYRAENRG